jgi:DNA primase
MPVRPLNGRLLEEYQEAATLFEIAFRESQRATGYVAERGISDKARAALRLGLVPAGTEGFEKYGGRLAVPYINMRKQVTGFKFRSLDPESDNKYLAMDGFETTLYNIQALNTEWPVIALCEGEADVWSMTTLGIPALGVPGVTNWKPHHKRLLDGFTVLYFPDDDPAGHAFAKALKEDLPDVVMCGIPGGLGDVNEALRAGYGDRLREMVAAYMEGSRS